MNIELKRNQTSLKNCVSNAILERKNRKSFKIHESHKMNEQISLLASRSMNKSQKNDQSKQQISSQKNQDSFFDCQMRSVSRLQEILQIGPQSIGLKEKSQGQFKDDFTNNLSQINKKTEEKITSIRKLRNLCNLRNHNKPSYPKKPQKKQQIFIPRKNSLYSRQRLSVCIASLNNYSRISQRLTRDQINATQKLKTQQSRGVTIFSGQVLQTPEGKTSQIKRQEIVLDTIHTKKILVNRSSFSPSNFRFKNYFGPTSLAKRDTDYLFDGKLGYLSVKGMSKSIEQKGKQVKYRNKPILQKIQHHLLTVNSANLLNKRQRL